MSTDADSVRSGRSRNSIHLATTIGISLIIQIGIGSIPVLGEVYQVFQAIQMFVDSVLDPENVGHVETRDTLNETCKRNVDQMIAKLSGPEMTAAITSSAKNLNPEITDDELKRQIAIQTSLYHREFIFPPIDCFNDYVNPDATGVKLAVSFSGPPTDSCKDSARDYYNAYYAYIDANKLKYEQEKISDASQIKKIIKAVVKIEAANKVKSDRSVYDSQLFIVGILFGLSFITVLSLFLVQGKKEGMFSSKKTVLPKN